MRLPSKSGSVNWNNYSWGPANPAVLACFGSVKLCFRLNLAWSCGLTALSRRVVTWGSWTSGLGFMQESVHSAVWTKVQKGGWLADLPQNGLSPGSKYRTNVDLLPFSVRWNRLSQKPLISEGVLHRGQMKIKFVLQNLLMGTLIFGSNYLVVKMLFLPNSIGKQ